MNKGFAPIILILIILVATATSFFIVKNDPYQVLEKVHLKSETANWKTYRNDQYGFEFKYPGELKYLTDDDTFSFNDFSGVLTLQNFPPTMTPNYGDDATFQMLVYAKKNSENLENNTSNPFVSKNYIILFDNTLNKMSNKNLFDQILPTFKFTNPVGSGQACTKEAKQCPDKSYVTRTGSNCEFAACLTNMAGMGTLSGTVSIGPVCPVENIENPCTPSPEMYAAHEFVVLSGQKEISRFHADNNGAYYLSLSPGIYTVTTAKTGFGYASKSLPQTVTIKANQTTTLNVGIDTGIR